MNVIQMIANLDFNAARVNYRTLPYMEKFEKYLMYKYMNNRLCTMSNTNEFQKIAYDRDNIGDKLEEMLHGETISSWTGLEMYEKEFAFLLTNNEDVLIDYYHKLLIFDNCKDLQINLPSNRLPSIKG